MKLPSSKSNKRIKVDSSDDNKSKKTEKKDKELKEEENKNYYKMTKSEFQFIYNLYQFEKLNRRPGNDIKIYYFIIKNWIDLFKDFFNCKKIYRVIDKNITNYRFMDQVRADMIPDEILKIKTKDENLPYTLLEYKGNEESLIKLEKEDFSISYYPFKLYIIEESVKNSLVIGNKTCNFEKGLAGVMYGDTLYVIIDEKTLEIFIFDESDNSFDPFCLFCYKYTNDLNIDLNKKYKYKEIKQCLRELDFMHKKMPKYIRNENNNVTANIIYLLGEDPSENIRSYLEELNKEKKRKEKEIREREEKILLELEREEKKIIYENKRIEKEKKEERRKERKEREEKEKEEKEKRELEKLESAERKKKKVMKYKLRKEKENEEDQQAIRRRKGQGAHT